MLIKKEYEDIFHIPEKLKKLDFKEFSKIITKKNEINTNLISTIKIKNIKKPVYVNYNRKSCINYYKEIEEYIKDSNKIPNRLTTNKNLKKKHLAKKGINLERWYPINIELKIIVYNIKKNLKTK